jgi:nitroimidazol reductase NimA-like FMN-containing flavoprotein (pyridoxamine 5'-phosphate oxidase superfamily)
VDVARRVVAANSYLTLATADGGGCPWATPVWFAAVGHDEFFWASRPDSRHSLNILARPAVGIVIYDSASPPGGGDALYAEATAVEVDPDDRPDALTVYNARSEAKGLPAWNEAEVSGEAPHRLYRATATRVYVLAAGDHRIPVT